MKSSKINVTYMVKLAVLIAIILVMAFTPIGYIKTLGLEISKAPTSCRGFII